jgi:hypothetical protein
MIGLVSRSRRIAVRRGFKGSQMRMIELSGVKGGVVWVNPAQVLYAGLPDNAGGTMYGDNNNRAGTRLFFPHGATLEVREPLDDVAARLNAGYGPDAAIGANPRPVLA